MRSFKAVLLHNSNVYAAVTVAHSVSLKEEYTNFDFVLQKLNYNLHKGQLCSDLKVIN